MLGEHGMWYKRTYFDPSTRVPLIFSGPGVRVGQRVAEAASLVDLFPTFLDLGGLKDFDAVQETVDGDSLCGVLAGKLSGWKNFALSEYYSEGVCQPMRMGVSGGLKYVYVNDEASQLFDLKKDPHEKVNCIDDLYYACQLNDLKKKVHKGWDPVTMRKEVIASQQRRQVINEAQNDTWDVQPSFDASKQYVRGEGASDASRRLRLPKFE
jgi:choline-sulfatase